jgi:tetratricopeptide (TPR) repeat protein
MAAIERLYPDRQDERVEQLAHHALRGELWEQAVAYSRRAGRRAVTRSSFHEAIGYYRQALAAIEHVPVSPERTGHAIDLRLALSNALRPVAEPEEMLAVLHEAEALAESLGDQRRLGRVADLIALQYWRMDEIAPATEASQRALAAANAVGSDVTLQIVARFRMAQIRYALGEYQRAIDLLQENIEDLRGKPVGARHGEASLYAVYSRCYVARCLAAMGQFTVGTKVGEEALDLARFADSPYCVVSTSLHIGELHLKRGDIKRALPLLEQGDALGQTSQILNFVAAFPTMLGYTYALAGRDGDAARSLEAAAQLSTNPVARGREELGLYLAEGRLLTGQRLDAVNWTARILAQAQRNGQRGAVARGVYLLGEIAAEAEPPEAEEAEARYRQALTLAEELGMRPLVAHCHLGLGTLYQKVGHEEPARAELAAAIELYRAMEMPYWLAKAEAASRDTAESPPAG